MGLTLIAPIATAQTNQNLYVGRGSLKTIQNAVDFAAQSGGAYRVIIPAGYAGADTIAAVLRGSASITIVDERLGPALFYQWNATTYVETINLTGEITEDTILNLQGYNLIMAGSPPPATAGNGQSFDQEFVVLGPSIGQDTTGTTGQEGGKGGYTTIWGGHGGAAPTGSTNGDGGNVLINGGYAGRGAGAPGVPGDVLIQDSDGLPAGVIFGDTYIGGRSPTTATIVTAGGDLSAPNLTAGSAEFDECEVANSPVRTFANTPDAGPGPTYPPAGVGISTGTSWEADSINPDVIALTDVANEFTAVQMFKSLVPSVTRGDQGLQITWNMSDGQGETDFINSSGLAGGGFSWYNGVPASVVTPSTTPLMKLDVNGDLQAGNFFATTNSTVTGIEGAVIDWLPENARLIAHSQGSNTPGIQLYGVAEAGSTLLYAAFGPAGTMIATSLTVGGNISTTAGTNLVLNPITGQGLYLNWNTGNGTFFGNGNGQNVASISTTGNLTVTGGLQAVSAMTLPSSATTQVSLGVVSAITPTISMVNSAGPADHKIWDFSVNASTANLQFRTVNDGYGAANVWMEIYRNGYALQSVNINTDLNIAGNVWAGGTFTAAGAKNFRIVHPLDDTKYLTHSCIEGPETVVFYRGEGETSGGIATITLPDYFEALTTPDGRTVQLTERFDDDPDPTFGGFLAAGRVKDGKFTVRSSNPATKFYWEVKAVRGDVEPLAVVTDRPAESKT
jgi:hypothetical protein